MKDVADAVGVSEATVSRWESGEIASMRRSRIVALANVLHISPLDIVGQEHPSQQIGSLQQFTQAEEKLLQSFRNLNEFGQEAAITMMEGLSSNPVYIKKYSAPTLDKKQA